MKYLQRTARGADKTLLAVPDDFFEQATAEKKKGLREVKVVHLKHKIDGRSAVILASDWDKFGAPEKAEWDEQDDPETRDKSILKAAFEQSSAKAEEPTEEPTEETDNTDNTKEESNG